METKSQAREQKVIEGPLDFIQDIQTMKEVLKAIDKDQRQLKGSCERMFRENTRLTERVKKLN